MRARCNVQHVIALSDHRSQRRSNPTARLKSGAHTPDLNGRYRRAEIFALPATPFRRFA